MKLFFSFILLFCFVGQGIFCEESEASTREKQSSEIANGFRYLQTKTYSCGGQTHSVKEYLHEKTGLEFALIPGGTFKMGGTISANEKPIHEVKLSSFLIAKHEVSQAVWKKIMGTTPWEKKSRAKSGDNYPAVYYSWQDAVKFCEKANLSLPTEAQWEYACRAGTTTKYYWGDKFDAGYAWYYHNTTKAKEDYCHEIGKKKANAYGLHDMLGNAWEWCSDWYDSQYYKNSPSENPQGPKGPKSYRVLRGGSFYAMERECRSAYRTFDKIPHYSFGFRPCVTLSGE